MPTTAATARLLNVDQILQICESVRDSVSRFEFIPDDMKMFVPFWRPILDTIEFRTFWRPSDRYLGWAHCSSSLNLIELSYRYFCIEWNRVQLYQTILHEIAHVLTPGQKHNEIWEEVYTAIGGVEDSDHYAAPVPYDHKTLRTHHNLYWKLKDL